MKYNQCLYYVSFLLHYRKFRDGLFLVNHFPTPQVQKCHDLLLWRCCEVEKMVGVVDDVCVLMMMKIQKRGGVLMTVVL